MDNQQSENRIKKLENQIQSLEKWKAEKEKQQIAFPLDSQSIEILNKYFMRIYKDIIIINTDYPGEKSYLTKYLGRQGNYIFDMNESKIYQYTVNISTNYLSVIGKNFTDGTRLYFMTTNTPPNPIDDTGATDYYVINSSGSNFQITTISGDAGSIVDITDTGVGSQFIYFYIEVI